MTLHWTLGEQTMRVKIADLICYPLGDALGDLLGDPLGIPVCDPFCDPFGEPLGNL